MLKEIIKNKVMVEKEVKSWEDGIRLAAKPLLEEGYIEERYIDAMIENVVVNGSYIVILPDLAIPHARPETGALKTGISVLKLEKSVKFPDDKDVKLMFVLSATDSDTHLDVISELTEIFMDEDIMEDLFKSNSKEEILEIIC